MSGHRPEGFTLLEMVIAIVTLSVLAMLVTPHLSQSVRLYNENAVELKTLDELRYASERIARELRDIRRSPASPADYDIVIPSTRDGDIRFVRNNGIAVTIKRTNSQLSLSYNPLGSDTTDTPFPLTSSLPGQRFVFLRSDENPALTSNELAYIEFELQLAANGRTYSRRSRVAMRAQP